MTNAAVPEVAVLGGGFGGLESAFYLRKKVGKKANITLVSDRDKFLFKPNTIYVPFGMNPEKLMFGLDKPTRKKDIKFVHSAVTELDPEVKKVTTADGTTVKYDYLIISTGAGMRPDEIPGMPEYANTIWTPGEMKKLGVSLNRAVENAQSGKHQKILFVVPPNNKCSGPLYEIVQMTDVWLRKKKVRDLVDIRWTTFESGYIQAFGPRLNDAVTEEFEKRGISGHKEHVVDRIEESVVHYKNGAQFDYDVLVAFPPYVSSTLYPQLEGDDRGFIKTDLATRRVPAHPEIFAVGDTADFPVKQAFLAFLQADAAADQLAAEILGKSEALEFEPTSMCVMEQFNKATFAQVPLRLTGDPARPVEVRMEDEGLYKVGSNSTWRLGKKLLGIYLPWRFKRGEPFHAGLPWKGMEVGLKMMSKVMAA
jgi:sulfide:quinone oxidoreductase